MALSGVSATVTQNVMPVTALTVCAAIISAKVTAITAPSRDMWVHAWTFRIGKTPGGLVRCHREGHRNVEVRVIQGNVHSLMLAHRVVYVQLVMEQDVAL